MDELDILKKDWNKEKPEHKKLSTQDIYPMLHKKSSSIVKTLFYISIAELVFWILFNNISYFTSDEDNERLNEILSPNIIMGLNIFFYSIIALFIYLLFKAHRSISVTDNAKKLMESILKTRKIIKYYVIYNLVAVFIISIYAMIYSMMYDPTTSNKFSHFSDKEMLIFMGSSALIIAAFMLGLWLFYKLLYGLLLKRLNKNYKELKKLEV